MCLLKSMSFVASESNHRPHCAHNTRCNNPMSEGVVFCTHFEYGEYGCTLLECNKVESYVSYFDVRATDTVSVTDECCEVDG